MERLDGKVLARTIKAEFKAQVEAYLAKGWRAPHLCAILVGNDGASQTYVASKAKDCEELGMASTIKRFDASISEEALLEEIRKVNANPSIDGLIVQMPVP